MAARVMSLGIESPVFSQCPERERLARTDELGSIYEIHYREVLQLCRHFFPKREDAEDAAAEIFLKLHRILEKRDPQMPFAPWLSQVARRHCIDKLRQRKAELRLCLDGIDLSAVANSAPSPLSEILRKEKELQIREQLNRLADHHKVPLVLRYYKQMSYKEIAGALNRGLPAVRLMIFRAKIQLRNKLLLLGTAQATAGGCASSAFRHFSA
jgi:RNA polymerase sigma-70 factor (ECF subfamily)